MPCISFFWKTLLRIGLFSWQFCISCNEKAGFLACFLSLKGHKLSSTCYIRQKLPYRCSYQLLYGFTIVFTTPEALLVVITSKKGMFGFDFWIFIDLIQRNIYYCATFHNLKIKCANFHKANFESGAYVWLIIFVFLVVNISKDCKFGALNVPIVDLNSGIVLVFIMN